MGGTRTCSFRATGFKRDDLEHMAAALAAMGIKINIEISQSGRSADVTVGVPADLGDAETARTRNAGRSRARISPPPDSPFTRESTCEDFVEWLDEGHTADEAMAALGIKSRATYFRRLRIIRQKAEDARERNPRRRARGIPEYHPTLGGTESRY